VHLDNPYQKHMPLTTCFVALQDTVDMGLTTFILWFVYRNSTPPRYQQPNTRDAMPQQRPSTRVRYKVRRLLHRDHTVPERMMVTQVKHPRRVYLFRNAHWKCGDPSCRDIVAYTRQPDRKSPRRANQPFHFMLTRHVEAEIIGEFRLAHASMPMPCPTSGLCHKLSRNEKDAVTPLSVT
jgi:hypothetical protein